VGDLRRAVTRGEALGPDDRHHDDPPHAGPVADLLKVPGRGGEELRGRPLVGRGPGCGVDDALHACQGLGQTDPGDHVYAARTRDRDDVVPRRLEHLDDMAADSPRRPRHCDRPSCLHDLAPCSNCSPLRRTADKEMDRFGLLLRARRRSQCDGARLAPPVCAARAGSPRRPPLASTDVGRRNSVGTQGSGAGLRADAGGSVAVCSGACPKHASPWSTARRRQRSRPWRRRDAHPRHSSHAPGCG
jgi:hypothetical protein